MQLIGLLRAGAVCLGLAAGTVANAMPILEFQLDAANSNVTLTETGGFCVAFGPNCGVTASLASGFGSTPFSIGTGDTFGFDFLTFTTAGLVAALRYDIEATLAFLTPVGATTTGNGIVRGGILAGTIIGGRLAWNNVPTTVTLAQGSTIQIDFQDGAGLIAAPSVTTGASVFGVNVVPIPATLLLLGLGSVGLLARVRRQREPIAA